MVWGNATRTEMSLSLHMCCSPCSVDWTPKLWPQREPHKAAPAGLSHRLPEAETWLPDPGKKTKIHVTNSKSWQETHDIMTGYKFVMNSYCIEDRLVFGQCNHAQPVAQILQQWAIREIGSCLVRGQEHLREGEGNVSILNILIVFQRCCYYIK